MLVANSSCPDWPAAELARHAVVPHVDEWASASNQQHQAFCCARRRHERWTSDDAEGRLRDGALRLLVLVAGDSANATQSLALANAAALSQLPEAAVTFLVVVDRCASWSVAKASMALLGVPFSCVEWPLDGSSSSSSSSSSGAGGALPSSYGRSAFRPKLPLQLHGVHAFAREWIASFDAIWLPDADVRLTTEATSAFLLRWACAFSAGPPLIAQPVLHGRASRSMRSQQFWPFNYGREWQPSGRLSDLGVRALHIPYVEQQAPLIDAAFFLWFGDEIGAALAPVQQMHNTDIGTDELWCRAAARFANLSSSSTSTSSSTRRKQRRAAEGLLLSSPRPNCAVIPVPFLHRGFQRKRTADFWQGSAAARDFAQKRWPDLWLDRQLLEMYKLSSMHVEPTKRLPADRCMVSRYSSLRLGPSCDA